jgi:hypothetical protein
MEESILLQLRNHSFYLKSKYESSKDQTFIAQLDGLCTNCSLWSSLNSFTKSFNSSYLLMRLTYIPCCAHVSEFIHIIYSVHCLQNQAAFVYEITASS